MPRPNKNKLNPSKSLVDYASQDRILKAYNNNMKEIREDASRYRSIIRKRLDRMESAGEIYNPYYEFYKDREKTLASIKGMSDREVMRILPTWAAGVSGAYKDTLGEVRQARQDTIDTWSKVIAEAQKDEIQRKTAEAIEKNVEIELDEDDLTDWGSKVENITPEQLADVGRIMGMITHAVGIKGKLLDSSSVYQDAMKAVLGKDEHSLRTKAVNIIKSMGLDDEDMSGIEKMKDKYNWQGRVKVSYQKSHKKRGK